MVRLLLFDDQQEPASKDSLPGKDFNKLNLTQPEIQDV
jgi:hypothetical protein